MRKKKHPEHVNHERWLVSYADFITLLFAFFVVLYASSQVDQRKAGKLSQAIEHAFKELGVFDIGAPRPSLTDAGGPSPTPSISDRNVDNPQVELMEALEGALRSELDKQTASIDSTPEGIVISLREIGVFPTASTALKPGSEKVLSRIAGALRHDGFAVRIEGHTDNVPIHNEEFSSNWELSARRAVVVLEALETRGISGARLSAVGYGEHRALLANDTESHRAANRRIDIVVLTAVSSLGSYVPAGVKLPQSLDVHSPTTHVP
ncbi:MAG: flagellar motor protein MotB [Acidobacteriaceae bacterium]